MLNKQFKRLRLQAGINLSSPHLLEDSIHGNGVNNNENTMMCKLEALKALQVFRYTMIKTQGISLHLLISKYLDLNFDSQVQELIHIGHDAYPKCRELAQCEFAERWETTQEQFFSHDNRESLLIFKPEDNRKIIGKHEV